jgi:hypothetical protein
VRKTTAIGASLLLAVGLAAGLAGPAAALPTTYPDSDGWGSSSWGDGDWDSNFGDRWDGGSGRHDGERYDWPEETRSYEDTVCPDMDVAKTDVSGDRKTITLTAPDGKLISSYCVKAGSYDQGLGPKIVQLDEPQAQVTIAYPVEGRCKDISHYSVAYVDAPAPTPSPSQSVTPSDEPTPATSPSAPEAPVVEPSDEPSDTVETTTPGTPDDGEESEVLPPAEGSPSPSDAAPAGDDDNGEAGPVTRTVIEGEPVAAQSGELAMTGPQVVALALAALALVGVGVGAVMVSRRRRESQAA